jgi:EthD domain
MMEHAQMVKLIYTGTKKPDQTLEEFRAYYLEHHAPLFLKTVPQALKYTINFPTVRAGKEPPTLDYDFITEIWWEDIDAVRAFYNSDAYKTIIEPDEQKIFATGSAVYFDEFVQKA